MKTKGNLPSFVTVSHKLVTPHIPAFPSHILIYSYLLKSHKTMARTTHGEAQLQHAIEVAQPKVLVPAANFMTFSTVCCLKGTEACT